MILRWVRRVLGVREPTPRDEAGEMRLDVLAEEVATVKVDARRALERRRVIAATRGATTALKKGNHG